MSCSSSEPSNLCISDYSPHCAIANILPTRSLHSVNTFTISPYNLYNPGSSTMFYTILGGDQPGYTSVRSELSLGSQNTTKIISFTVLQAIHRLGEKATSISAGRSLPLRNPSKKGDAVTAASQETHSVDDKDGGSASGSGQLDMPFALQITRVVLFGGFGEGNRHILHMVSASFLLSGHYLSVARDEIIPQVNGRQFRQFIKTKTFSAALTYMITRGAFKNVDEIKSTVHPHIVHPPTPPLPSPTSTVSASEYFSP